jgi:O-antigen ligase
MPAFSSTGRRGDLFLMRLADWLVVLVAIALPWSTSGTAICIVAWLVAVLPTLNLASVRRELESAAAGLPVLLWCFGVIGMLWADASWTERFQGLGSFHRLLVIPFLLAQFRRTAHSMPVIYGFLISSALALIATYVLTLTPGLTWRGPKGDGIAAHDDIFQGSVAVICGFGALGYAAINAVKRHWQAVLIFIAVAAVFLGYFLFVSIFSRIVLGVAPVLTILLGWRFGRLKGLLVACLIAAAVSVAFWVVSPGLRERVHNSIDEITEYSATNKATSIGQHLAFLTESLTIIASAPLIGHGTGSIAKEFRAATAGGRGASAVPTVNPHNQTFAVAIQIGLLGAIVLWSMWIAHLRIFRGEGSIAWLGTVIVVENIVSSTVHSHLFDSAHGWLYVFGVGVLGGTALHKRTESVAAEMDPNIRHPDSWQRSIGNSIRSQNF